VEEYKLFPDFALVEEVVLPHLKEPYQSSNGKFMQGCYSCMALACAY